jgi:hypothetical protein
MVAVAVPRLSVLGLALGVCVLQCPLPSSSHREDGFHLPRSGTGSGQTSFFLGRTQFLGCMHGASECPLVQNSPTCLSTHVQFL